MSQEALESHQWRAFRLFLGSLEDQELKGVARQLQRESEARQESDTDPVRLFLSSLSAADLELARQHIVQERTARGQERRLLVVQRRKTRTNR